MGLIRSIISITVVVLIVYVLYKILKKHKIIENFTKSHPVINQLQNKLKHVHPIIGKCTILKGDESYTLNKNKIYLCLADKKTGQLYDENMLTYVLLHEVAHMLNTGNPNPDDDVGHTPQFHKIFDDLLAKAESLGLFDPEIPLVENYCE
jgi:hypothetical protein